MKKFYLSGLSIVLLSVLLLGCQSHKILENEKIKYLVNGETETIDGIQLTATWDDKHIKYDVIAKSSPMKDGYVLNEKLSVIEDIRWDNTKIINFPDENGDLIRNFDKESANFYPFINLDLFVFDGKKNWPIQKFDITVTIQIPYAKLNSVNRGVRGDQQFIFVFDHKVKVWDQIETKDKSGIHNINRGRGFIEFDIIKWPDDDRIICSGP